jgi:hypothetical protein
LVDRFVHQRIDEYPYKGIFYHRPSIPEEVRVKGGGVDIDPQMIKDCLRGFSAVWVDPI